MRNEIPVTTKNEMAEYFLDNFGFGAYRIDSEGNLVYTNSKFLQMLGFDFDFQIHEKIANDINFRKNLSLKKYFEYVENNFNTPVEKRWIKSDNQTILLREFIKPVKNKNGEILFFDCIVEDITDKYILENIFQDITTWNYSLLKALPDPILILTHGGQIVDFQNEQQVLLDNSETIVGKHINQIFTNEITAEITNQINLAFQDGEVHTIDVCTNRSNIDKFFEAHIVICNPEQVMMVLRDTTLRKKAEIELQATSEKLKVLNKTKDRFMSIIAHDLRTPINGLLGYSEILSNDLEELSSEEIKEYSSSIADIALSTNRLLTNLLEWSRIQSGNIVFNPAKANLHSIVARVFNLLSANAVNKKINLINKINSECIAFLDENIIEMVFLNLLGNAIKFTNPGGFVEVNLERHENEIQISIKDNGVGIANDIIGNIFNAEQHFTTLGTNKEKGTGLGLLLCKEFIELHGGTIRVESRVNDGTCFYFTILDQPVAD